MYKIMFVCHGNICRSPMAEFVFKKMINERGLSHKYFVASSATSNEEIGNPVYPPARACLERHNISCAGKRAVRLCASDYAAYDLFVGMDCRNVDNMLRLFEGDPEGKVRRLLDLTALCRDVADPWYTGDFDATYSDVTQGCEALLNLLENGKTE